MENKVKGCAKFENGRLITPKKPKEYNKNLRVVIKVRKYPIISKKEIGIFANALIEKLCEKLDVDEDLKKDIIIKKEE